MHKDYAVWHPLKIQINDTAPLTTFRERDVWWGNLGENVGFEEDGKNSAFERPIYILRKFSDELFIGIPITSRVKDGRFYFMVNTNGVNGSIILSQVRALSSRRLIRRMARLTPAQHDQIRAKLFDLL